MHRPTSATIDKVAECRAQLSPHHSFEVEASVKTPRKSDDAEADLSRHHLDIGDLFGEVLDRCALWPNGRRQALPRLEDRGTDPPVQA